MNPHPAAGQLWPKARSTALRKQHHHRSRWWVGKYPWNIPEWPQVCESGWKMQELLMDASTIQVWRQLFSAKLRFSAVRLSSTINNRPMGQNYRYNQQWTYNGPNLWVRIIEYYRYFLWYDLKKKDSSTVPHQHVIYVEITPSDVVRHISPSWIPLMDAAWLDLCHPAPGLCAARPRRSRLV